MLCTLEGAHTVDHGLPEVPMRKSIMYQCYETRFQCGRRLRRRAESRYTCKLKTWSTATLTVSFCRKTGILVFGEAGSKPVQQYIDTVRECGVSHEVFTGREANRRYPDQLKLPDSYKCVYEHDAGILRASKAVTTLQVAVTAYAPVLFAVLFSSELVCESWWCVERQPQSDQDHPRSSGDCGDRQDQFQSQEDHSNSWSMDQQTAATHWTHTTTQSS